MTKEQIINKHWNDPANLLDAVPKMMDEFAKQEGIGLIQFMYGSCAETIPNTRPAKWLIDLDTEVTFEQLYKLYEQSKTKTP
jgi:hypothetical protein